MAASSKIRSYTMPYKLEFKMNDVQVDSQLAKEALRRAVTEALDRKRRLGQYAVIYENGRLVRIGTEQCASSDRQG